MSRPLTLRLKFKDKPKVHMEGALKPKRIDGKAAPKRWWVGKEVEVYAEPCLGFGLYWDKCKGRKFAVTPKGLKEIGFKTDHYFQEVIVCEHQVEIA